MKRTKCPPIRALSVSLTLQIAACGILTLAFAAVTPLADLVADDALPSGGQKKPCASDDTSTQGAQGKEAALPPRGIGCVKECTGLVGTDYWHDVWRSSTNCFGGTVDGVPHDKCLDSCPPNPCQLISYRVFRQGELMKKKEDFKPNPKADPGLSHQTIAFVKIRDRDRYFKVFRIHTERPGDARDPRSRYIGAEVTQPGADGADEPSGIEWIDADVIPPGFDEQRVETDNLRFIYFVVEVSGQQKSVVAYVTTKDPLPR
mgnify:FL=1